MAIDKQRVEDVENEYKEKLFDKIGEIHSKQFGAIDMMTKNATNLGQLNVDIPNVSTLVNNKIVELSYIFKKAGISIFAKPNEKYDFVGSNFIGDAIIQDLIDKLAQSTEKLTEYSQTIGQVSKKKNEQIQALQNVSPIRKFFSRIRSFFVSVKPVDFSLTEEEQATLDSPLQEYRDLSDEIWNYNLENSLVPALVKAIAGSQKLGKFDIPHRYNASVVPGLLEESVIPDLKNLGLEQLVPKLQEALIEEYKKDLPDPEIYQVSEEDMHLYVPDFSRKPEPQHSITEEMQELHQKAKEGIKAGKKSLRSIKKEMTLGGLGLESFEAVDLTVSASQRRETTTVISTELSKEQSNERDEQKSTVEKDNELSIE